METLKQLEALALDQEKQSVNSLLEVLKYDVDDSFDRQYVQTVSSDVSVLSIGGGQVVNPGATVTVNLRLDGSAYLLDRCFIVFELLCTNGYVQNAAELFDINSFQIGRFQYTTPQARWLMRQKMDNMAEHQLKRHERGLLLPLTIEKQNAGTIATAYAQYDEMIANNFDLNKVGYTTVNDPHVVKCCVPLTAICAQLSDLKEKMMVTMLGQFITLSGQLSSPNDCMIHTDGGALNYQLQNCQLYTSYAKLDTIRQDLVLKSVIDIPMSVYHQQQFSIAGTGPTINLNFSVPRNERIKRLLFAFNKNFDIRNIAGYKAINADTENVVSSEAGVYNRHLYPMNCIALPIEAISVDINGNVWQLQMSNITFEQHFSAQINGLDKAFTHPIQSIYHSPFSIDLQRYVMDDYGSGAKDNLQARFTIILKDGVCTVPGQNEEGWTNGVEADKKASTRGYTINAYLQCQTIQHLRQGQYSN